MSTRQADRSESTRAALIAVARTLFAERGYAGTATEEVVRAAGVTRGALYHHFRDKRELFAAVFEDVERDLMAEMVRVASAKSDAWASLVNGCNAFLDACLQPDVQRIVLLDAPSVLGRDAWRAVEEQYALGLLTAGLQAAINEKFVPPQPVSPLAHLLLAAINEAGLLIAQSPDTRAARAEIGASVLRLLDGLRSPSRLKPSRPHTA